MTLLNRSYQPLGLKRNDTNSTLKRKNPNNKKISRTETKIEVYNITKKKN